MSASSSLAALYPQLRCPALVLLRTGLSLYARAHILAWLQPSVATRSIRTQLLRDLLFQVPTFPDERHASIAMSEIERKRRDERVTAFHQRVHSSPGRLHFIWLNLQGRSLLYSYMVNDSRGFYIDDRLPRNSMQRDILQEVERYMIRDGEKVNMHATT